MITPETQIFYRKDTNEGKKMSVNKEERIAYLREQIAIADDAYRSLGISGISDAGYDRLVEKLKEAVAHLF